MLEKDSLLFIPCTNCRMKSIMNRKAGVLDMIRESVAEQRRDPGLGGAEAAAKSRCVALPWGPIGAL